MKINLYGHHQENGGDGYIPGLWNTISDLYLNGHITFQEYGNLDRVFKSLLSYENTINWDTVCKNCALLMDRNYSEYVRAEKAEAQLAEIREFLKAIEIPLGLYDPLSSEQYQRLEDLIHQEEPRTADGD